MNQTDEISEAWLLHFFTSDLCTDIEHVVLNHEPKTLDIAITLIHLHEHWILQERGPKPAFERTQLLLPTLTVHCPNNFIQNTTRKLMFKHLTTTKLQ